MSDGLAGVLGRGKSKAPAAEPDGDEAPSGEDYSVAGDDILQAVKDGDAGALGAAIKRLVLQCMADEGE